MMTRKILLAATLMLGIIRFGYTTDPEVTKAETNESELKALAEKFVKLVDENDAEALKLILHPQMIQYTQLGDKLIPFKGADFIEMVAAKKLGGVPRKVTHLSAQVIRGKTALVITNAVSSEYDFMYQLSMVNTPDGWMIVGILTDITKAG